jgi:hypothetical protein
MFGAPERTDIRRGARRSKMPYKDPLRKEEWEEQHRPQRLARRRELRRIEKIRQEAQPELARVQTGADFFVPLIVAGCGLALYEPMIGVGVGGLTLLLAALYKKSQRWWIAGFVLLAAGLLFQRNDRTQ